MRLFGFNVSFTKAPVEPTTVPVGWDWRSSWFGQIIHEPFTGAWQRNREIRLTNVLTFPTIFSCITLIAQDIGKLTLRLMAKDDNDIWNETSVPAFSPVLKKPNRYQTRQKFIENWISSKLCYGNTYVLKERDQRNVVTKLYVLDPQYIRPLVAPDGDIFYQLTTSHLANQLAGLSGRYAGIDTTNMTEIDVGDKNDLVVPASEIIHDIYIALYHPLCGISPITACGLAAMQGLNIQRNSEKFFENFSQPGGIVSAPGPITDVHAKRLKDYWEQNFSGANAGRVAILGDGLTYQAMSVTPADAKLIEQLKWTSETICSVFHVPPYMVSVGPPPSYNNIEALNQQYYSQCLQTHIEAIEALLDEGLGLTEADQTYGTEFDLDDLLRMDTATQFRTYGEGVSRGILAPNEARKKINLKPVRGGATPYLQQQNYSLAALDKRDAKEDPFATKPPPQPQAKPNGKPPEEIPAPEPQKLLPNYSKLSADEMYETLGSAL